MVQHHASGLISTFEAGYGSMITAGLSTCMVVCPDVSTLPKQWVENMKPAVLPFEGMQTADIRPAVCMSSQCGISGLLLSAHCVNTADC